MTGHQITRQPTDPDDRKTYNSGVVFATIVSFFASIWRYALKIIDTQFFIVDNADTTKVAQFEASGIATATTRTFSFPDATTTLVGTDTTQTLTNKTVTDNVFTIQDQTDNTKKAQFECSGISASTTRTYTLPNNTSTLVDLITAQTMSSKTLTTPAITSPTITQSTTGTVGATVTGSNGSTVDIFKVDASATSNAQITGVDKNGHLYVSSANPPTIAAGTGAGTSGTPTVSVTGNDQSGFVSVTPSTAPATNATVATVTFKVAYNAAPKAVILTPRDGNTINVAAAPVYISAVSATTFTISVGATALIAAAAYTWWYLVL